MYNPNRTVAILPTGSRLSPKSPAKNVYVAGWRNEGTVLLLSQAHGWPEKRRYVALYGSGPVDGYPAVGATIDAHHDQTLRQLGRWTVEQRVSLADAGNLNQSAPLYVYK